jgi:hypothetical protein
MHTTPERSRMSDHEPAWLPDPLSRNQLRWWNGAEWTDEVANSGNQSVDPIQATDLIQNGGRILEKFDSDNPYLQRLFAHEAFGVVPTGCDELLSGLQTTDPEERLISALRVRHGLAEGGVLMVTTHWLRYVKHGRVLTVIANDELWPLDGSLDLEANLGGRPLFRTPDGHQFQVFPTVPIVSRRQAKGFLEVYRLATLATNHLNARMEVAALEGMASSNTNGVAAEIKQLVKLRNTGVLSNDEFESAKARTLSS